MNGLRELLKLYRDLGAEFLENRRPNPATALQELHQEILRCRRCQLHENKTHYVPGEGALHPDFLFVGEGPGETEDRFGRPFIGKAGQLLDKIIQKMGYRREDVFIGNIVKCRPPNNREPLPEEAAACLPHLQRQIDILAPRVIVCLGKVAFNHLVGIASPIGRTRGRMFHYGAIPVVPTYHPSYILHKKIKEEISQAKWEIWEDMEKALALLKSGA